MKPEPGIRNRFVEIRFDGDRTMSGVVMRYGDVAKIGPKGFQIRERFEPGAFGDVSGADVILNVMHDRTVPIARTGGGGLELVDSPTSLELRATLPDTQDANDALTKVRSKILRGFSVEFRDERTRVEGSSGEQTYIIERATLRGVALADRPAYAGSTVNPRSEDSMTEEQVAALVKQELEKRGATDPDMAPAIAKALSGQVRTEIDDALKKRDEANAATATAAREAEQKRAEHEATVEARVDALTRFRSLLPTDFDHKGKSVKDILVAAAGDEVKDAEKRSEDYLLAKVEGILERRGDGSGGLKTRADDASATGDPIGLRGIYNLRKVS